MSRIYLSIADNGSGSVRANYMRSLVAAVSESGLEIELARASDSLATRAMNNLTNAFLESDCDECVIIDCDILCMASDLRYLFEHDVELVYGAYPKRQPRLEWCFSTLTNDEKPPSDSPLWSVRRCGRGFVRFTRSLLEKMKEDNGGPALRYHNHGKVEWEFWPSGVISGEYSTAGVGNDTDGFPIREFISEDWQFCDRARALGVPVLLDTRIHLRHEGDCIFPIHYAEDMLPQILSGFSDEQIAKAARTVKEIRG